jgi:hypothetical protein
MRSLTFVLVITVVGGCIPVPTRGQAYAGNLALMAVASVAAYSANMRDCDYVSKQEDVATAIVDSIITNTACEAGRQIQLAVAESVLVAALVGIGRTLVEDDRRRAATTTSRSR